MNLTQEIKNEAYEMALNKYSKSFALDDDEFLNLDVLFTFVSHQITKNYRVGFMAVYNFLKRNKNDLVSEGRESGRCLYNYLEYCYN